MAPARDQDFLEFVRDQLARLPGVSAKRMFGAIGLYQDASFFGLIDEGRLYFLTGDESRKRYIEQGMKPFEYAPGEIMSSYYEVPVDVLEDDRELCAWAREAVDRAGGASQETPRAGESEEGPFAEIGEKQMRAAWKILLLAALLPAAGASADEFDSHWRDGQAELDGYRLVISRYGQDRAGTAVMIFVTEPFSESKRVKEERPPSDPKDTIDVLKLNLVRDFQTGIYDYNTMVSVFVRTATMEPVKVSFSSAEWCGQVYSEMIIQPKEIRGSYSSYFEDESGPIVLGRPAGGLMEDELFIALRGLRQEFLAAGESRAVPYLPGVSVLTAFPPSARMDAGDDHPREQARIGHSSSRIVHGDAL